MKTINRLNEDKKKQAKKVRQCKYCNQWFSYYVDLGMRSKRRVCDECQELARRLSYKRSRK